MFYQQAMKPKELLRVIPHVDECFFVIEGHLPNKDYRVAIYKYDDEYFLLRDPRILKQLKKMGDSIHGDEEQILPYIEEALESNLYYLVDAGYVKLDLATLAKMSKHYPIDVRYYEFID